jgi:hypothetical protein
MQNKDLEDAIKEVSWLRLSLLSSAARMEQFAGPETGEVKRLTRQANAIEIVVAELRKKTEG